MCHAPTVLAIGPRTMENAGVIDGPPIDVQRANLAQARRVSLDGDIDLDPRHLATRAPGPPGHHRRSRRDRSWIRRRHRWRIAVTVTIADVDPGGAGNGRQRDRRRSGRSRRERRCSDHPDGRIAGEAPTTAQALLAGLDSELDVLTGWLSLLTSPDDLPTAWGLPKVAGSCWKAPPAAGSRNWSPLQPPGRARASTRSRSNWSSSRSG